jgi:hypothetical protein
MHFWQNMLETEYTAFKIMQKTVNNFGKCLSVTFSALILHDK